MFGVLTGDLKLSTNSRIDFLNDFIFKTKGPFSSSLATSSTKFFPGNNACGNLIKLVVSVNTIYEKWTTNQSRVYVGSKLASARSWLCCVGIIKEKTLPRAFSLMYGSQTIIATETSGVC